MSLIKIALTSGELLITKEGCSYQEVLDAFAGAESISVVTYNISGKQDSLLEGLRGSDARIRFITKIPDRYPSYFRDHNRQKAKQRIDHYLCQLEPNKFGALARIYFNFDNHAKVIMTESIAYIGSANFSEESSKNWECGVIIRDPSALSELSAAIDQIERDSIRYYGKAMGRAVAPLLTLIARLRRVRKGFGGRLSERHLNALSETIEECRQAISESDSAWYEAADRSGPIGTHVDPEILERIEDAIPHSYLHEFADAVQRLEDAENGDIAVDDFPTDRDGNIPDSAFDSYVDKLKRKRDRMYRKTKSDMRTIRGDLDLFCSQVELVCKEISDNIGKIDNTGK